MTCADTSSVVAYMQGEQGSDVELVDRALADCSLVLAPVSVSELFSDPLLTPSLEKFILGIQQLEIKAGYWERAGKLRAKLMRRRYPPRLRTRL